jgi:hypothetical protein
VIDESLDPDASPAKGGTRSSQVRSTWQLVFHVARFASSLANGNLRDEALRA